MSDNDTFNQRPGTEAPPPPPSDHESPETPEEGHGWFSIAEWMDAQAPESVDELRSVRELEHVYPLLRAMVGRSLREFLVRAAALKAVVEADRASLTPQDVASVLYWLNDHVREATLRALRSQGWLEYDPGAGTSVTDAGRWAYEVLSFLHKRIREGELLPTVAGLEYSLRIGGDPMWLLASLRSRLQALREEIDSARASHSEVVLRRAAGKLRSTLQLSKQIRTVLDRVPHTNLAARRISREIHDLLSRLHGASAGLHADITEIGRQFLELSGGLTVEQIVRALMRRSKAELSDVGRDLLRPVMKAVPLLTTEVMAAAAEQQALRDKPEAKPVPWTEPQDAARSTHADLVSTEVAALLHDLAALAEQGEEKPFSEVIPRGSPGESFLRASLLTLVGAARAGEGISARLGSLPLTVQPAGDGWPEPLAKGPLAGLTPGAVRPRKDTRNG